MIPAKRWRFRLILLVSALLPLMMKAQTNITGKWRWASVGGGQQITLDLKAAGAQLSGTIIMEQATLKTPVVDGKASYYLDTDTPVDELRALFFPPVTFQISEGRIVGNAISFTQTSQTQISQAGAMRGVYLPGAPASKASEKLYYTGQLNGDRITFTRTYHAAPNDPWIVGAHAVTFTVERLR